MVRMQPRAAEIERGRRLLGERIATLDINRWYTATDLARTWGIALGGAIHHAKVATNLGLLVQREVRFELSYRYEWARPTERQAA